MKEWWMKYSGVIKASIAILVSAVTALWGAFKIIDKQVDDKTELTRTVTEMHDTLKDIQRSQDSLIIVVDDFYGQLTEVHENTVRMTNYVEALHKAMKVDLQERKNADFEHYVKITTMIEEATKQPYSHSIKVTKIDGKD
jgi:hypothetical protein